MAGFEFKPGVGVVRVVEEVVSGDVEADLNAQVEVAQNTANQKAERHQALNNELAELESQVTAKGDEVEQAAVELNAANEDVKSANEGRDSYAQARALQSQVAESDPETENDETASDEVEIPVHQAVEAEA